MDCIPHVGFSQKRTPGIYLTPTAHYQIMAPTRATKRKIAGIPRYTARLATLITAVRVIPNARVTHHQPKVSGAAAG